MQLMGPTNTRYTKEQGSSLLLSLATSPLSLRAPHLACSLRLFPSHLLATPIPVTVNPRVKNTIPNTFGMQGTTLDPSWGVGRAGL
jgi:hypothetical protein